MRRLVSIGAAALLVAAACGDDGEGPSGAGAEVSAGDESVLGAVDRAEGEPVRVGFVTDGQNPSTDQSAELGVADATAQYLNEHRAGLAGRPIELVTCEARLDPATGTDCANRMVEEGVPVVVVGTTGVVDAVWRPLHEAGIPTMFFAASGDLVLEDPENTFAVSNPESGNIDMPIDAALAEGLDKVTVIVIDVPAAIAGYEGTGAEAFDEAGVELELVRIPAGTADMTSQLGEVVEGDPGVVHVLGNDSFCISAFQALAALGHDGTVTTISQCVTDATRNAVPADQLEGLAVSSPAPVDIEDESTALYRTVLETFDAGEVDTTRIGPAGTFLAFAALDVGLDGLEGEVTPESVITTLKSMPPTELPGGAGLSIRCDGTAVERLPAVCAAEGLYTTLDDEGRPTPFQVAGAEG